MCSFWLFVVLICFIRKLHSQNEIVIKAISALVHTEYLLVRMILNRKIHLQKVFLNISVDIGDAYRRADGSCNAQCASAAGRAGAVTSAQLTAAAWRAARTRRYRARPPSRGSARARQCRRGRPSAASAYARADDGATQRTIHRQLAGIPGSRSRQQTAGWTWVIPKISRNIT